MHDLAVDPQALQLLRDGKIEMVPVGTDSGYQSELDYFVAEIAACRTPARATPAAGRLAVEIGLEELRQIGA